jgi:1,4-dihydroxy-2-naphthoyl-CoA hydrolase
MLHADQARKSFMTPFITHNKVRMHDTDMAGILYFPRQFRFAHDALEDFIESEGIKFKQLFTEENFVFVVVHAEADYYMPIYVGDELEVHLFCERIGNSSFTLVYKMYRMPLREYVGSAKTIHVALNSTTRTKIAVPGKLRTALEKHLIQV